MLRREIDMDNEDKKTPHDAHGFTIIELLVSLLLSSFLMLAVIKIFISNQLTYGIQQSVSSIQEQGRYLTQELTEGFMHAGYSQTGGLKDSIRILNGTNANDVSVTRAGASGEQYSANASGGGGLHDQIVILLEGGADCYGVDNWPTGTQIHWKYYYVDSENYLVCQDSKNNIERISGRVEAFQLQYGVDLSGEAGQPNTYVSSPTEDQNIVSIRFAVVVKSHDSVTTTADYPDNHTMQIFNESFANGTSSGQINFKDGRLRRMFFSTVRLRNSGFNAL